MWTFEEGIMDTEEALLEALHADPADEVAWLALADWLDEHDRGPQAELLRLHRIVRTAADGRARQSAVKRIRALLRSGVRPCVPERTSSIGMRLALIRSGRFLMGSAESEPGHEFREAPVHEVEITRPFYLGIFPVTQAEFQSVMRRNPSEFRAGGDSASAVAGLDTTTFPVDNVTWQEAVSFCRRLSSRAAEKRAGREYRLPTEAEWEYACRAWLGNDPFSLGQSISARLANYDGRHPYRGSRLGPHLDRTSAVGSYPPNPFGLYDMHGNVWEWCSDWYDEEYYAHSPPRDPAGPEQGDLRVQRGGCWGAIGECCRSASRDMDDPDGAQFVFGMRVAMSWPG
jgi:uncharacterized protein (TIGR02996 family)